MKKRILIGLFSFLLSTAGFSQTDISLTYTSFLGGEMDEDIIDVSANSNQPGEFVFIANVTSDDFPMEGNSYQSNPEMAQNTLVFGRINDQGILTYSTYFRGSGDDISSAIELSDQGSIFLAGYTSSPDFPIMNADNGTYGELTMGFLAKFNSQNELQWSTFIGGDNPDLIFDIKVDSQENVYVAGMARSDGLATFGVYAEELFEEDLRTAFLAKYNSVGEKLWFTYYPQEEGNRFTTLVLNTDETKLYAVGHSSAQNDIIEATHQASNNGQQTTGLVSSWSSENGSLNWATYFGGNVRERDFTSASIDEEDNLYFAGETSSDQGISTMGSFQEMNAGSSDHLIAKFSPSGGLVWATYFGGSGEESFDSSIQVEGDFFYFSCWSGSNDVPIIGNPLAPDISMAGPNIRPGVIAKFDLDGNAIWSSISNENYVCGSCINLVKDPSDQVFCVGYYYSEEFIEPECDTPTFDSAYQEDFAGGFTDLGIFIYTDNSLSTTFPKAEPLVIYPNPAQDRVTIEAPNLFWAGMELTVTDLSGRTVDRVARFQSGNTYSTSHLSEGVYILTGQIGERMFREKLVVHK